MMILVVLIVVALIIIIIGYYVGQNEKCESNMKYSLDDCISSEDIQFKIDTYQKNLKQELAKSKEAIKIAKQKGYIKVNTAWTERFDKFTEVSNTLYKNLEYENARKLSSDKFHRYTNLHFRSMLLGNLAYLDYKDSKKVRDEINRLLVDIGKKKVKVTKKEKAELYSLKDTCVKTTKYLYDRMIGVQSQTGVLRDKIRDECGTRGYEWYKKISRKKKSKC